MTTTLLIIRHGNTFDQGQLPRRVGSRTDLPLSESGLKQIEALAHHLKKTLKNPPFTIFSSPLLRTHQSAKILAQQINSPIYLDERFKEIDYGVDENQIEEKVLQRIGSAALKKWDQEGIVPPGWLCDPVSMRSLWINFGKETLEERREGTTIVLTSNGCARFATSLDPNANSKVIKLKTAHYMFFCHLGKKHWTLKTFNESYAPLTAR